MVGRPKKDANIEEVKTKVYYPLKTMNEILKSPNVDDRIKGQLSIYHKNSKKVGENTKLRSIDELNRYDKTGYGRFITSIKDGKELYNYSAASMKGNIRNLLFRDNYWDIDFVNCHPVIALSLFKKHGLPFQKTEYYVNNREECLEGVIQKAGGLVKCNRQSAKTLFLRIFYGGKIYNWCQDTLNEDCEEIKTGFYKELESEIQSNMREIIENTEEYYRNVKHYCQGVKNAKKDTRDIYPATFAYICQDIERKCLMAMKTAFENRNYRSGTLIYDGFHILMEKDINNVPIPIPDEILREIENDILKKTTYPMKITIKDMFENKEEDEEILKESEEQKLSRKLFEESFYENMKNKFEETHFKVEKTGLFITIEKDPLTGCDMFIKKKRELFKTTYEHLKCLSVEQDEDGNDKYEETRFIETWFKDPSIKLYKDIQFLPPPLKCPENIYNTWTDFVSEKYEIEKNLEEKSSENLERILNHFKMISGGYNYLGKYNENFDIELIENEEKDCYEYLVKWFASIIQKPANKTEVLVCLRSLLQGVGKTWLYCFLQSLLGSHLVVKIEDVSRDLFGSFNSTIENKLFLFIDEINNKIWKKHYTEFLQTITENETTINEKGISKYTINSFRNVYCATNSETPLSIVKDDRRIFAQDIKMNVKPPAEYYTKLFELLKCKSTMRKTLDYFKNIDISSYDPKNRPKTSFYEDIQEVSADPLVVYLKNKTFDLYVNHGFLTEENKNKLTFATKDMKDEYVDYQRENKNKDFIIDSAIFGKKIKNLNIEGLIPVSRSNKSYYKFDIEKICKCLIEKRHIKQSEYETLTTDESAVDIDDL